MPPSTVSQAVEALTGLLASPNARILRPSDNYWPNLQAVLKESGVVGNLVFDAQIVALCRDYGVTDILTEDRDFSRFSGLTIHRL